MINIFRYENNIAWNPKEYLLDDDNQVLNFPTLKEVFRFLSEGGVEATDQEGLEDYGIFLEGAEEEEA